MVKIPPPVGKPIPLTVLLATPRELVLADAPPLVVKHFTKIVGPFIDILRVRSDLTVFDQSRKPIANLFLARLRRRGPPQIAFRKTVYAELAGEFGFFDVTRLANERVAVAATESQAVLVWEPDRLTFIVLVGKSPADLSSTFAKMAMTSSHAREAQ